MSLNYQYHGVENTKSWSKADWELYDALIWATMAADIGYLNELSAEEFCRRVAYCGVLNVKITPESIKKFYGLTTNVSTLTATQWAQKHGRGCRSGWVSQVDSLGNKMAQASYAKKMRVRVEGAKEIKKEGSLK